MAQGLIACRIDHVRRRSEPACPMSAEVESEMPGEHEIAGASKFSCCRNGYRSCHRRSCRFTLPFLTGIALLAASCCLFVRFVRHWGGPHSEYCDFSNAAQQLDPSNGKIRYTGRIDFSNPSAPSFSWVSTQVAVSFAGSTLMACFSSSADGARLLVVVNGSKHSFVQLPAKSSKAHAAEVYTLVSGLGEGTHTVQVWKVSEDDAQHSLDGIVTFHGFALPHGSFLNIPYPRPRRRIEFLGDSDTTGYCADGTPGLSPAAEPLDQNSYQTWSQRLANALEAEVMVEAISGKGVTRQSDPMHAYVSRMHAFSDSTSWDFKRWTPDAIIFLIGPNDCDDTKLKTSRSEFITEYLRLLDIYVDAYSYVAVNETPRMIHVCGGSINGLVPCPAIQDAVAKFNARGARFTSYYTSIDASAGHWQEINSDERFQGCYKHYNGRGHQILMQDILHDVRRIMGWEETG